MRGLIRPVAFVAVAAVVVLGLTGCEPALNGQVSVSIDGEGRLLIGVCKEMTITEANVRIKGPDDSQVVEVEGFGHISASERDVLVVGPNSDGLEFDFSNEDSSGFSLTPSSRLTVSLLEAPGAEGDSGWGSYQIPDGGLRDGVWLFSDGSTSDQVCGTYEKEQQRKEEHVRWWESMPWN